MTEADDKVGKQFQHKHELSCHTTGITTSKAGTIQVGWKHTNIQSTAPYVKQASPSQMLKDDQSWSRRAWMILAQNTSIATKMQL